MRSLPVAPRDAVRLRARDGPRRSARSRRPSSWRDRTMCPTPIGRIHTRVAIIFLPAVLGLILSLITGREDWIVLIGVYLLLGVALDTAVYSWAGPVPAAVDDVRARAGRVRAALRAGQHPEARPVSTLGGDHLLLGLWILAIWTKIVLLPLVSLTYLESAGEFRRVAWSIPESQVPLAVGAHHRGGGEGRARAGARARPPACTRRRSSGCRPVGDPRGAGCDARRWS